jgi:recombination protein RecA
MVERKRKGGGKPTKAKQVSNAVVGDIRGKHGADTALVLGDSNMSIDIKGVCSTQCFPLDAAIGRGGIPYGRLTVLAGPEGGGKTTVALHACAECQRQGGVVLYMDMEYKLDPVYVEAIGVNLDDMILSQPPYLEMCLEIIETTIERVALLRKEEKLDIPMIVILDSMTAAAAKVEIEGGFDDKHYSPQANAMSLGLKKLIPLVSTERVALVFVSQWREKIGVMFGKKEDTTCGKAPKFYASVGMDIKRIGKVPNNDNASLTKGYVWKNQIAPPFKSAEFTIEYGKGIDNADGILRAAIDQGIVTQAGAWYSYEGDRLGNGHLKTKQFIHDHPDVLKAISGRLVL